MILSEPDYGAHRHICRSGVGQALRGGISPFLLTQNQQFLTGAQTGRGRSEAFSVGPTVSYRMSSATNIDTRYRFSGSDQVATRSKINQGAVQLNRILTPVDTGNLRLFGYGLVVSGKRGAASSERNSALVGSERGGAYSQVITLGWIRELSSVTTLVLRGAGPRILRGSVASAEAHASLSHLLEHGNVELAIPGHKTRSSER